MSDVVKLITTIGIVGASDHPAKATAERELQSVRDELFDLRQRVAELEADKARLDWIEGFLAKTTWAELAMTLEDAIEDCEDSLRPLIDAAMAQQKEGVK